MEKKVLILCTGNSCRSIIAEALINSYLDGVSAESSGVEATGEVNPSAHKVLEANGIWNPEYHSKTIDKVIHRKFDLIVTVCDNAKETCPSFPKKVKTIHVEFEDPAGKPYEEFEKIFHRIKEGLLPMIKRNLFGDMKKSVNLTSSGVKIAFTGAVKKQNIVKMVENCATGECECMSDETKKKIQNMEVSGDDGDVKLDLTGDIKKEEIEEALAKSKVLNQ
jgi:arsenate reductase